MGGGSGGGNQTTKQKTKQKNKNKVQPFKPTVAPLTNIVNAAAAIPDATNTTPTPLQQGAIQGLQDTATQAATQFNPQQKALVNSLYGGAGLGQGAPAAQDAYNAAQGAYSPYLDPNYLSTGGDPNAKAAYQGFLGQDYLQTGGNAQANAALNPYLQSNYLDPNTNPYLAPAIKNLTNDIYNTYGDKFALAGRSESGNFSDALGRGWAQGLAPVLMGQYNTNVGAQQNAIGLGQQQYNQNVGAQQNAAQGLQGIYSQNVGAQQGAAQGLTGAANDLAGTLDATGLNRLNAQLKAAGAQLPLYDPYQQQLAAAQQNAMLPYTNITPQQQFLLPIAAAGQQSSGKMTGTTTTTMPAPPQQSPWQTAAGLGLSGLGLLSMGSTGGLGGSIGSALGTGLINAFK